jgi:hypothetical protein
MNRKLDVARVFERIFGIYRDQFTLLIPAALVVFLPVAIVDGLILNAGGVLLALIAAAIGVIATYWYQGMVVEAARDILDGRRDQTVGTLIGAAGPVVAPLIGAGFLAGIAIAIGFVLLIVPGLILLTIWAVIVPVIVIERTGVFDAFGRSRQLVKGNGWQVFGVIVVIFLITFVIRAVIQGIIGGITDSFIGYAIGDLIANLLLVPLSALAASVMFFELKALHGEPVLAAAGGGQLGGAPAPGAGTPAAPGAGAPPAPGGPEAPPPGGAPPATGPEAPGSSTTGGEGVPDPPAQPPPQRPPGGPETPPA